MSRTQRAIGAKMLHDAYLHVIDCDRLRQMAAKAEVKPSSLFDQERNTCDLLSEAERFVRNGFRMPSNWAEFMGW